MNINPQNILTKFLYNNISQNIELENVNIVNKTLENINNNLEKTKENNLDLLNSNEELKLLLNSLNQAPTKENIDLIKILVKNNLPITKDNLQDIIKSTKIFKDYPIEKALFLIENKIKPNINIGEQIDNYISKNTLIDKQIESIFSNLNFSKNNDLSFVDIFKNTSFENTSNINFNVLKDLKTELLQNIDLSKNNLLTNSLNKLINSNTSSYNNINNYNKSTILKEIIDFTISENLLINTKNLNIFEKLINSYDATFNNLYNNNLKENINSLISLIDNDSLIFLQKELFNIINSNPKLNLKFKDAITNFNIFQKKVKFFEFKNSSIEELNKYFDDISTISKNLKNSIDNIQDSKIENIINNLDSLNKNIDFMNNLKSSIFLQIPVNINNFSTTAELLIFSNKKNKNNIKNNKSGSALISLNLLNLGKLEVFINKINSDISCQFKLEKDSIKSLIKENILLLDNYLKDKNLILKDITFKDLDESFSLISYDNENNTLNDFKLSNFNKKA